MTMLIGIGTASIGGMDLFSRLEWIRSQGFRETEIYCCPSPKPLAGIWARGLAAEEKSRLKAALEGFDKVDFHAPFQNVWDISLVSANPIIRRHSIDEIRCVLELASAIDLQGIVTCHTGWPSFGVKQEDTEHYLAESLQVLSEEAGRAGVRIGVEVADYFMPPERFSFLEELALPRIGITLDTGHMMFMNGDKPMYSSFGSIGKFVERFTGLLLHVHVHDHNGTRDHVPIGTGTICFEEIFSALKSIRYEGAVSLELNSRFVSQHEALESKTKLEALMQ